MSAGCREPWPSQGTPCAKRDIDLLTCHYVQGCPLAVASVQGTQRVELESARNGQLCVRACAHFLLENKSMPGSLATCSWL